MDQVNQLVMRIVAYSPKVNSDLYEPNLRNKGDGQILFSSQTGLLQEACSQVGQETALSGPFGLLF